jgi:hypothetical protein
MLCPAYREPQLYYWAREERASSSEVDFVLEGAGGRLLPVEVKSGASGSLKSLRLGGLDLFESLGTIRQKVYL